jgi:translocation and assembly module TamA
MRSTIKPLAFVLFAALALQPVSASAFLFGLFGADEESDADAVIADPRTYDLTFETNAEGRLDEVLRAASNLWADRDRPASGVAGLLAKARGDYRRLTAALYNEGYYGGAIAILVDGREATSLPPDANLREPSTISVTVVPGPQFRFGRLIVNNRAPMAQTDRDVVEAPEEVGFRMGDIARATVVARAEQRLIDAWRYQGYAKAEVVSRDVIADHTSNTVDVVVSIAPGPLAAVGQVGVTGTERMNTDFVVQQTGLVPGQRYHPDDIERAQSRLSRLEVFRALRIEEAASVGSDGLLPLNVIVQEQALRRFGAGATLSTVDGLGVEGFWLHRNLFGQAERLRLDARIAGIGFPVETEEFDYLFGGTFTKPGVFTPDTDLVAAISAERTVLPRYIETSASGRVGLTHLFSDELTLEGAATAKIAQFEDDFGVRDFQTVGLLAGATFDNRDDALHPTEGVFLTGTIEPVYEFSFGNPIVRTTAEARTYFSFDEDDNIILAGRVRAGALAGPGLDAIPPDMLFFAGGGGSVRGYGFRSIGVEQSDGTITGGRYLLEASAEARVQVTRDFGAVAFIDGGYVAADTFPGLEDLRLGAGVGLRYFTPIGPLRLDLAIPLNRRDGDPDYALYLGIGQAF